MCVCCVCVGARGRTQIDALALWCSVLQYLAVCCSCAVVRCSLLQHVAVCCSMCVNAYAERHKLMLLRHKLMLLRHKLMLLRHKLMLLLLPMLSGVGSYGVATVSRLLKIVGLFCKRAL